MPRAKTPRNNTSSNKQVIPMPEVTSAQTHKSAALSASTPADLEAQIRQRAYELYEERGRMPGQETEDWFRAEREVLARNHHQQSA